MDQGIVIESVWVAVGFIVFVALIWRKVGAALGSMLCLLYTSPSPRD